MPRRTHPRRPPPAILGKGHAHIDRRRNPKRKERYEVNVIRDQLTNATGLEVYQAAYQMVDSMQQREPGVQVAAAAMLFLAMCDSAKVCMKDTLESVDRMTTDTFSNGTWVQTNIRAALKDYIDSELMRKLK